MDVKRILLIVGTILLLGLSVFGQQDSQYTQYMYNTTIVNPAYAGSRELLSINSIYRNQWVGLNGAPENITASVNTPLGGRVGLGVSFINDAIGPSDETNFAVDFSYSIPTSAVTKLSFGLKGGFSVLNVDFNDPDLNYLPGDPNILNINSKFSPTFGVGAYWHSNVWYLGLSSPNILSTEHYDDVTVSVASEKTALYFIGGYVFNLSSSTKFKPTLLTKAVKGAPLAVDVSANFLFNDKFTLGAAWRWDAAVSALAGFQVSDQIIIGYAFDYDATGLGRYNDGSHEIFLRFEFLKSVNRVVNPRFF